jgi:hypothetical protein
VLSAIFLYTCMDAVVSTKCKSSASSGFGASALNCK